MNNKTIKKIIMLYDVSESYIHLLNIIYRKLIINIINIYD